MSRITAPERMRRVLAIVPWIAANPGHHVSEVADRFGLSEKALLDDLGVVFMVGLPPYSPDALVDVMIDDDGCVSIDLADFFSRPLRLTTGQALSLIAASEALLSVPGTESDGPLSRALGKVKGSLGVSSVENDHVDVRLGDAEAAVLDGLRQACASRLDVEIDYYSFGRDTYATRMISPWRVFADEGSWYVHAWCTLAQGERVFRLDRIDRLDETSTVSTHQPDDSENISGVFHPRADDPRVTLKLSPAAAWVAEAFPCESVEDLGDGSIAVQMIITAEAWLYRLLLQLGPDCQIVEAPSMNSIDRGLNSTAAKILSRYRV